MTQTGKQPPHIRIVPAGPSADAKAQAATGGPGGHRSKARIAKDIGLFFAAPFVTLAYLSLFPFIAIAMLVQVWRHQTKAG
jgi:hypothetical protein